VREEKADIVYRTIKVMISKFNLLKDDWLKCQFVNKNQELERPILINYAW